MLIHANQTNFETEAMRFNGVAVVDFWAPWCGPCKMLAPLFEELSNDFKETPNLKFIKVNTDENPEIAANFQIRGIPAIKIIKNGVVVDEQVGFVPKETLKNLVSKHL